MGRLVEWLILSESVELPKNRGEEPGDDLTFNVVIFYSRGGVCRLFHRTPVPLLAYNAPTWEGKSELN